MLLVFVPNKTSSSSSLTQASFKNKFTPHQIYHLVIQYVLKEINASAPYFFNEMCSEVKDRSGGLY